MKQPKCKHNACAPLLHSQCQQCKREMRWRHDCASGAAFPCYPCKTAICVECCPRNKDPNDSWEDFHRKWVCMFKPDCHRCGDTLTVGEGFCVKVKGQIVGYCSHYCYDHLDPADEDSEWSNMHPPFDWLDD